MTRLRIFIASLALILICGAALAASASQHPIGAISAGWRAPAWRQFHIEQHVQIRITPGSATMPSWVIEELEEEERYAPPDPRKAGKCLSIGSIATVRPGDGDELLLFLHDDRIISATLQKRCNARDFYSGFLVEPNADGAICTGRDILHSRSGDNCKLRQLHELGAAGFRRFP